MRRITAALVLLLGSALGSATPARETGETQDLETLRSAARSFLATRHAGNKENTRIDVAPPDSRLRLAACPVPLQAALAPGARDTGNVLVEVRCHGASPWRLFVQARVQRLTTVLVTTRPLARGEKITADDVAMEKRDVAGLTHAYFSRLDAVEDKRVKRGIGAGVVLSPTAIEAIPIIRRGDAVTILAQGKGIEVRVAGEALADAGPGDPVRVRNAATRRIVDTTAVAPGTVKVLM